MPSPEDLPNPGIEPGYPALQVDFLPTELSGKLSQCRHSILSNTKQVSVGVCVVCVRNIKQKMHCSKQQPSEIFISHLLPERVTLYWPNIHLFISDLKQKSCFHLSCFFSFVCGGAFHQVYRAKVGRGGWVTSTKSFILCGFILNYMKSQEVIIIFLKHPFSHFYTFLLSCALFYR